MKRGLKVRSINDPLKLMAEYRVTFLTPMKRGLKEDQVSDMSYQSYIPYPDEKGTESTITVGNLHSVGLSRHRCLMRRYIPYPDEKGTESISFSPMNP